MTVKTIREDIEDFIGAAGGSMEEADLDDMLTMLEDMKAETISEMDRVDRLLTE